MPFLPFDLLDLGSCQKAAETILQKESRLDILSELCEVHAVKDFGLTASLALVANAGVAFWPLRHIVTSL